MKIRFKPSQLAAACQAQALCRFIAELKPESMFGEVLVTRAEIGKPLEVKLLPVQGGMRSVTFEPCLLYTSGAEGKLREQMQELFGRPSSLPADEH